MYNFLNQILAIDDWFISVCEVGNKAKSKT